MLTNHGVHEWQITAGLPDTGGQNIFVNQFTDNLVKKGYKVTIANRGGYPHPVQGNINQGLHYKNDSQRLLYLEDEKKLFVSKEDMSDHIQPLANFLVDFFSQEEDQIDMIISHYWDAGCIAAAFLQHWNTPIKHIWVPHSLGIIKKQNVLQEQWASLRIDERIQFETELIKQVDGIAATSSLIKISLTKMDYSGPILWLPPCVDVDRYFPDRIDSNDPIWDFLSHCSGQTPEIIQNSTIITEISRTDTTKRKDILIKAFASVLPFYPDTFMIISINKNKSEIADDLINLIKDIGIENRIAIVGSIWDILPKIYQVSDIYCTPSIMEGFGMSAQEAAASQVPVIASHLVPFATEYLLDEKSRKTLQKTSSPFKPIVGEGAIIVEADDIDGFADSLQILLEDDARRDQMGKNAFQSTIPQFTWDHIVRDFLTETGLITK